MDRNLRKERALSRRRRVFDSVSAGYLERLRQLSPDVTTCLLLVALSQGEKRFRQQALAMNLVDEVVPAMALSRMSVMLQFLCSQTGWGGKSLLGPAYDVYLDVVQDIAMLMKNDHDRSSFERACTEVKDIVDKPTFNLPAEILSRSIGDWYSRQWDNLVGYTDFDVAMAFGSSVAAARQACMELKTAGTLSAVGIPYFVPLLYHTDAPGPPLQVTQVTANAMSLSGLEFSSHGTLWAACRKIEEIVAELDDIR